MGDFTSTGRDATAAARTPTKSRSLSDSIPTLDPSPKFIESAYVKSKDDNNLIIATPSRLPRRGNLSLQVPARDINAINGSSMSRGGQSPQPESRDSYVSPSTVLPRHSRGLDFSRACTSLHHSTSVDQASPTSSPTVSHKAFPSRRQSTVSMMVDSPRSNSMSSWLNGGLDKSHSAKQSISTPAFTSDDSNSSDSDEDMFKQDDLEDSVMNTPQARKNVDVGAPTPYGAKMQGLSSSWSSSYSPIARGLPHFRRQLPSNGQWSNNSINNGEDSFPPIQATSQPIRELSMSSASTAESQQGSPNSRRGSLVFGSNGLQITPNIENEELAITLQPMAPRAVRRAVPRRSDMMPKPKGFARIRAALREENSPIDSEAAREAEVVRQVRVKEVGAEGGQVPSSPPDLTSKTNTPQGDSSELSDFEGPPSVPFFEAPQPLRREDRSTSGSKDFWSNLYLNRLQTPPPISLNRGRSASGLSDDNAMDMPLIATPPQSNQPAAPGSGPQDLAESRNGGDASFQQPSLPSLADITRKINKRRRDEDYFDPSSIKRRAVSPGVSVASSPACHSPVSSTSPWWGNKPQREGSGSSAGGREDTSMSLGGATPTLGPKRVGLQGMTDTNDGLMKMTIE